VKTNQMHNVISTCTPEYQTHTYASQQERGLIKSV